MLDQQIMQVQIQNSFLIHIFFALSSKYKCFLSKFVVKSQQKTVNKKNEERFKYSEEIIPQYLPIQNNFSLFISKFSKYNNLFLLKKSQDLLYTFINMISQQTATFQFMKQQGNIYTNFKPSCFPKMSMKKVRALILGHCGNGKTYFLNRMSGKVYKTGFSRGSLTRDIAYQDSIYLPEGGLRIYDTPGTNSKKETMMHALVLRRTIQTLPIDLILIQAKLSCRFEQDTLQQLKYQSIIFEGYEKNIVYLISHLDILDIEPQDKRLQFFHQFNECLKQNKVKIKIIMYSNKNSDFKQMTNILYTLGFENEKVSIKINDKKFYKHFNITEINVKYANEQVKQCLDQIKEAADSYIKYAQQIPFNDPNNDDMIPELKIQMKQELKAIQNQQFKKYSQKLEPQQYTDLYLLISQNIHAELEKLDLKTEIKLKKQSYFQIKKIFYDVRDLLKKCPHCGLIWMRVQGCQGETSCGGRAVQFDIFDQKPIYKYQFKREGPKLKKQISEQKKLTQQDIKRMSEQRSRTNSSPSKNIEGLGCHKLIQWDKLPQLQNIEQILKQMYNISNFEQIQIDYNNMMIERKQYQRKMQEKLMSTDKILYQSMR